MREARRPEGSATPVSGDLDVEWVGAGPLVVLVHGSIVDARRTWRHQRDLGERWRLCIPNRPGFGASPPLERGDFELEAPLMASLLGDGAHLVGHSYGAVIALLAAAARPGAVRSLVVSEPGARERPPWEAELPLADLATAAFPKLVISGEHSAAFETVCDVLADAIGAERAVIAGRGHTIPSVGAAYNDCVDDFLGRAEAARPA
jgi:hypothetical protein